MKRVLALPAILALLTIAACSEPQVVIEATVPTAAGASEPLANLPIRLLPYDRDAIVDSLAAAAETDLTRDYFIAEDQDGRRFWLFRESLYRPGGKPRWFLHGFFA